MSITAMMRHKTFIPDAQIQNLLLFIGMRSINLENLILILTNGMNATTR
jgi:hypothetical protein